MCESNLKHTISVVLQLSTPKENQETGLVIQE